MEIGEKDMVSGNTVKILSELSKDYLESRMRPEFASCPALPLSS